MIRFPLLRLRIAVSALPLLGAIALAAAIFGCGGEEKEATPVVSVKVQPARRSTISQVVTGEALVFPVQQASVAPKISSTIREFKVQRGSHVRKGQLLAVLENKDLSAAELQSKGEFEQAQAAYISTTQASLPQQLQKARLDADAAKSAYEAQQKVYDSRRNLFQQGAIPRRDLDAAEVSLAQAKSQYESSQRQFEDLQRVEEEQLRKAANGQLESAQGKYEGATAQLSYSEIRSPIDGVVTDRPLYAGEMAAAGTPLLTVMDTSQVTARAHIPQQSAALLRVGDKATIIAPEISRPIDGKVSVISPALDPNSTTVEVWVQAKNPGERLKPGTSVQVSMLARSVPDALTIPPVALLTAQDGTTSVMLVG